MPIHYKIDKGQVLIHAEVIGELTINETIKYFNRIQQDENIPNDAIEVVDFDKVTDFKILFSDMKIITQSYQSAKLGKNIAATIFVATTQVAYGIARMLQTLHLIENEQHIVQIVRSEKELEEKIKNVGL